MTDHAQGSIKEVIENLRGLSDWAKIGADELEAAYSKAATPLALAATISKDTPMTTDTRDIEDRLQNWYDSYYTEIGPADELMAEFLMDVLAAKAALAAARKREEELSKLVHMPGMWHCAKCNFTLMQSNLNALDGSITARDNPGDKCPNDGSPLWRVSYRQAYKEMMEIAEQAQVRHRAREEELTAVVAGMVTSVGTIMQDTWNDFCSDTGCHPDDITHEGRKLFFHPAHWARAITEHLAALAQLDGGANGG